MKLGETDSPIAESACWVCGHLFDRATGVNHEAMPKPGDVSICIQCGEIGLYDEHLSVTKPTFAQLQKIEAQSEVREAQTRIRLASLIFMRRRAGHA